MGVYIALTMTSSPISDHAQRPRTATRGSTVNVSSCPGCGDTHLCAGNARRIQAGPTLLDQITRYVDDTFIRAATGVVATSQAYTAYLDWCTAADTVAFSQKSFVQAMQALRIRRVKRSTMRFAGITWKRSHNPGRHAAPEPAYAGAAG